MITNKQYRCVVCHNVFNASTNHYGEIYSTPCHGMVSAECIHNPDESLKSEQDFKNVKKGVKDVEKKKTLTKTYGPYKHIVKYGFNYLRGNSRPYFSITSDIYKNGREYSGGCCHDEVRQHFPELDILIRWHGVNDNGVDEYYTANAVYWLEKHFGISKYKTEDYSNVIPLEAFKNTVVFGALPSDSIGELLKPLLDGARPELLDEQVRLNAAREELKKRVTQWCEARLPELNKVMKADMQAAGIEYIKPEEYQK